MNVAWVITAQVYTKLTGIETLPLGTDNTELVPDVVAILPEPVAVVTEPDGEPTDEGAGDPVAEGDGLTVVADGLGVVLTLPFPMLATVVHIEEEGAGCAGGVTGSPWWKVEVPYTPMG